MGSRRENKAEGYSDIQRYLGDWHQLSGVGRRNLEADPERAQLALYIAVGHQQRGGVKQTLEFAKYAIEWGCDRKRVMEVLLGGVYELLAGASCLLGKNNALGFYKNSIEIVGADGDIEEIAQKRLDSQVAHWKNLVEKDVHETSLLVEIPVAKSTPAKDVRPSEDAIDKFIQDVSPFFYRRAVNFVDVGAFVGDVFVRIAKSGVLKIGEAHLFEPNPESFGKLKDNISELPIPSLHAYNCAVGEDSGKKKFSAAKSMTRSVSHDFDQEDSTNLFEVKCYSLDSLSSGFTDGVVDILKIDVEGFETEVLENAKVLLSEQRVNVIYVEVGFNRRGTQQTYFSDIDHIMQKYGYRVFKIYEQMHEWTTDSPLLRRCNMAYMSQRFADANPYRATMEILKLKREISELKSRL